MVNLPITENGITDREAFFTLLETITPSDLKEQLSQEQYATLKSWLIGFNSAWFYDPVDYFEHLFKFTSALRLTVNKENFPFDFQLWSNNYNSNIKASEHEESVAFMPLFSAPKMDEQGEIIICLLDKVDTEIMLNIIINIAKSFNYQIPENQDSEFKITNGLDVGGCIVWEGMGIEKAVFNAIKYILNESSVNRHSNTPFNLRAFIRYFSSQLKEHVSHEIYASHTTEGLFADLMDRDNAWHDFAEKYRLLAA